MMSRARPVINWRKQAGINLVELMIGVTVALILLAGIIAAVVNNNQAASNNLKAVKLNTQVRSAMDLIHRELQRAGYVDVWDANDDGNADDNSDGEVNVDDLNWDAIATFGQITLANCSGGDCSCIIYSYDEPAAANDAFSDGNGTQDATDIFAIRQNGNAIQIGFSAATDCSAATWQSITDAEVSVTDLIFTLPAVDHAYYGVDPSDPVAPSRAGSAPLFPSSNCTAGDYCVERRKIGVTVLAQLATDPNVTIEINDEVKVQNDWLYQVSP